MEFRILGPLEAVSDEGPVKVPGAKPRAVLAMLLVNANQVVSRDRLVEDLWAGSPPGSPAATLQTYVYQLRRALDLDSLQTQADGYRLEVKENAVDALRFEKVVQEQSQARDTSPYQRSLRLREALLWWRGPALAGFSDADWAKLPASRLEELRLTGVPVRTEVITSRSGSGVRVVAEPAGGTGGRREGRSRARPRASSAGTPRSQRSPTSWNTTGS
jgi:DNA-binding SARP family transcriptional activator